MFLSKEEIKNECTHELLYIPVSRLISWFFYEPIPKSTLIDINEFLKNKGTNKYKICNEYIAIRGAGSMFTYGKDAVVVTIKTIFYSAHVVSGKKYDEYFYIRVYFHTIDDSARGLALHFNDKKGYIKQIERIKNYLYQHPYMDDQDDFEKHWSQFDDVETDYN